MTKQNNISSFKINCTGCKACYNSCPLSAIQMERTSGGFLSPVVLDNCINCGKCAKACPDLNSSNFSLEFKPVSYAMVNADCNEINKSSSGGVFLKLAKHVLNSLDGVVFGAAYCDDFKVKIRKAENIADLENLAGSKYVYADTGNSYQEAEKHLKDGRTVLYSGVSCQIAGLLSYLKKPYNNLICIEILCHGAPSQELFDKYVEIIQKKNKSRLAFINQRDKTKSWNPLITKRICTKFDNNKTICRQEDFDPYMSLYIRELSYRDSCYNCKYVGTKRYGDIVIGDFGGLGILKKTELNTAKGVSLAIVNSSKGQSLFESVNGIKYEVRDLDEVIKLNSCLNGNIKEPVGHRIFINDYEKMSAEDLFNKYYYKNKNYLLRAVIKNTAFKLLGHKNIAKFLLRNKK